MELTYEQAKEKGPKFLRQWRDEQKEQDLRVTAFTGVTDRRRACKIYNEEFINKWFNRLGMDQVYVDYSIQQTNVLDRVITCAFTPYGIKEIDGWFAKAIQTGKEDFEQLKKAILTNPHLHPIIRNNLYHNLLRYK